MLDPIAWPGAFVVANHSLPLLLQSLTHPRPLSLADPRRPKFHPLLRVTSDQPGIQGPLLGGLCTVRYLAPTVSTLPYRELGF